MYTQPYKIEKISRGQYQVLDAAGLDMSRQFVSLYRANQIVIEQKMQDKAFNNDKVVKEAERLTSQRGDAAKHWLYQTLTRFDKDELRSVLKRPRRLNEVYQGCIDRMKKSLRHNDQPGSTDKYKFCNHHHELTDKHEMVDFGNGSFVANKMAIPILNALNELGLRTRTHHIDSNGGFVSIILEKHITIEVKTVFERDANRTDYNGKSELLISWNNEVGP